VSVVEHADAADRWGIPMIKKLRATLVALVLICVGFIYGFLASEHGWYPSGVMSSLIGTIGKARSQSEPVSVSRKDTSRESLEATRRERMEALSQLGYLSGYEPPPATVGVLAYDKHLVHDGYNFFLSGDGPDAHLMDMNGNVLHTWGRPYEGTWPPLTPRDDVFDFDKHPEYWRRAHLFTNGDVLAILEGTALVKVDKDSNVLWAYRGPFHHDLDVTDDGRIFVLTRRQNPEHPDLGNRVPIIEDFITILSAEGELIRQVSLIDALVRSAYRKLIVGRVALTGDLLHTNTVELLGGRLESRSRAFRKGNALVSFRNIDVIGVVDLESEKLVWALTGMWKMQHQPTVLGNGNLLLFDNHGGPDGNSKVIEFDPFTQEIAWAFEGDESNRFYSYYSGSHQRLANGNTLVTSSTEGRVFELTPDRGIAWEWINPRRTKDQDGLVAIVSEMLRIEYDFVDSWLVRNQASK
jgi:hypothetical protein